MADKQNGKVMQYEDFGNMPNVLAQFHKEDKMKKKHWYFFAVISLLIIILTFINLGATQSPQSWWVNQTVDEYAIFEIPSGATPGELWIHRGLCNPDDTKIKIYTSNEKTVDSNRWTSKTTYEADSSNMYKYELAYDFQGKSTNYIILQTTTDVTRINEIYLLDYKTKEQIELKLVETSNTSQIDGPQNAIDEQEIWFGGQTNYNGMYFDEVFHASGAYEYINGFEVLAERTHPVLGKLIMALGILTFGMTPFGWRIMGALFSIATVFVMFLFAKKVFKKPMIALAVMCLSAVEGLRFTLGRIATIDVFALFFILLAYYFMYTFYENGIDMKRITKSLVPFALAGIFFGLATSVKWTGAYAGLGLLILLLIVAWRTIKQFLNSKELISDGEGKGVDYINIKKFPLAVMMTIIFGVVFYVVIPLLIYAVPFAIFKRCGESGTLLEVFIREQKFMFSFHSGLNDTHNSASPWWSWPLNGKSVYAALSQRYYDINGGIYSRVHIMQTTFMAFFGVWTLGYFICYLYKYYKRKRTNVLTKEEKTLYDHIIKPLVFLLVGYFSTWLPWAFIGRSTYIYHYYQPVTFLVLLMGLYLYVKIILERKIFYSGEFAILNGRKGTITHGEKKYIIVMSLAVINFLMFYPVFTGLPISMLGAGIFFRWANGFWGFGL